MSKRHFAALGAFVLLGAFSISCDEWADDENDIVVLNGSGCALARLVLDGVDRGAIGNAEVREFEDVSDGVHFLQAFRDGNDLLACDTHETEDLDGDEDDHWTIQCACD